MRQRLGSLRVLRSFSTVVVVLGLLLVVVVPVESFSISRVSTTPTQTRIHPQRPLSNRALVDPTTTTRIPTSSTQLNSIESTLLWKSQQESPSRRRIPQIFGVHWYRELYRRVRHFLQSYPHNNKNQPNLLLGITAFLVMVATLISPPAYRGLARLHPWNILAFPTVQALGWYAQQLQRHPLVTKSVTAGLLGWGGDSVAQRLEGWKQPPQGRHSRQGRYDARRGGSLLVDGLLLSGPLMHFAYEWMETWWPIPSATAYWWQGWGIALTHVLADTLVLDSIFVASTLWTTGLLEGYSVRQCWWQFRQDYIPTLKAGGVTSFLVLPLELACFKCLPVSFRVLAVNFIDLIWDTVISHMAHKSRHSPPQHTPNDVGESGQVIPMTPHEPLHSSVASHLEEMTNAPSWTLPDITITKVVSESMDDNNHTAATTETPVVLVPPSNTPKGGKVVF